MIVAEPKPIKEILEMVKDFKKILIIGCKGCVTVCNVGGSKEVGILASTLRINAKKNGKKIEVAIKKMIHGEPVKNKDALANPESLSFYSNLAELR